MSGKSFNIIGGAYADSSRPWANQQTINWEPISAEAPGTRTPTMFRGSPGLRTFATLGSGGVGRGLKVLADVLYAVSDTSLYSVDSAGVGTSLGTVAGSGRAAMEETGTYLVVSTGANGYTYNKDTLTFAALADPDFPQSYSLGFLSEKITAILPDSDYFYLSATSDPTSWAAADRAAAFASTDKLVGQIVDHSDLLLGGQRSTEFWYDAGEPNFPFVRANGATSEIGWASPYCAAKADNAVFVLGHDGVVYAIRGRQFTRVSHTPLEQAISEETLSEAFAFAFSRNGHWHYYLSFPSGKTWAYDVKEGQWFRRQSHEMDRWRGAAYAFCYGKHLIQDASTGVIWEMTDEVFAEGSAPLIAERITQYFHGDSNPFILNEVELLLNRGQGLTTGQGSDPLIELRYSRNGGRTWSNWRGLNMGKIGEYERRARAQRFGQFKDSITLHIRVSDPVRRDLYGATARVS